MNSDGRTALANSASNGVEFGPWETDVKNDDLSLVSLTYAASPWVSYEQEGIKLEMPGRPIAAVLTLEAVFLSRQKQAAVRFRFENAWAFRVLDECGLLELWHASAKEPRPAHATFRVRGHAWQAESMLLWVHYSAEDRFSYMIATDDACLEVVTVDEPQIELLPAIVTKLPQQA